MERFIGHNIIVLAEYTDQKFRHQERCQYANLKNCSQYNIPVNRLCRHTDNMSY